MLDYYKNKNEIVPNKITSFKFCLFIQSCYFYFINFKTDMDALGFIFTVGIIVVGGIYLWTYTKSGKRWLENL